jgi:hypothetical protein
MSDGTGIKNSGDADEAGGMDPQRAAAIMAKASEHVRHALTINRSAILGTWSLVYLLGYGAVWLSVHSQRPVGAPAGWALALLVLLAVVALVVTAQLTDRATSGVGGTSSIRRRIYSLSLAVGLLGTYVMQPALSSAGASRGVLNVFSASSPLLVAGVILVAGTAAWLNWYMFGLGIWLIAVAASSGFAGAAGVWAVDALAVGIPLLLMAAIQLRRR